MYFLFANFWIFKCCQDLSLSGLKLRFSLEALEDEAPRFHRSVGKYYIMRSDVSQVNAIRNFE